MANARYYRAEFCLGAHRIDQLPESQAEVAFVGRSNAGKSSAMNLITNQRKLARTSKTPGRTQQINCFAIGQQQFLVDLPGYGYAKVPPAQAAHWRRTLGLYVAERESLKCVAIVMDIRHPLRQGDWEMIQHCLDADMALHCILTKSDKVNRGQAQRTLNQCAKQLEEQGVEATLQTFSASKGDGLDDAHEMLDMYL